MKDSIIRNLHLLITTGTGENQQNMQYGCTFWDHDYDIHISNDERRELVRLSLIQQISQQEKRIDGVQVEVNVRQTELQVGIKVNLRHRLEIKISGQIVTTREPFSFSTGFYIGPYMLD